MQRDTLESKAGNSWKTYWNSFKAFDSVSASASASTSDSAWAYVSASACFIYAAASVKNQASAVVQHWL